MKRKNLFLLLWTFVLCFSMTTTFLAKDTPIVIEETNNEDDLEFNVDNLLECIYTVAMDAEYFGYEPEDFETVSIGLPIHTYEWKNDGKLKENDFIYYPVFSNDKVLFLILEHENGLVQMTQGFTDVVAKSVGQKIAFVYDRDEVYLVNRDSKKLEVIYEYEAIPDDRGDLYKKTQLQLKNIEFVKCVGCKEVDVIHNLIAPLYDPVIPTVKITVPKVLQAPYGNICWAASTASIGNYLTGSNYTAKYVAQKLKGSNFNNDATMEETLEALEKAYDIEYTYYPTLPTELKIYNNISKGYPMYACWDVEPQGTSHMTVISGINRTAGYIYVMDPLQGHLTANISNGGYDYVGVSGKIFKLVEYGSRY